MLLLVFLGCAEEKRLGNTGYYLICIDGKDFFQNDKKYVPFDISFPAISGVYYNDDYIIGYSITSFYITIDREIDYFIIQLNKEDSGSDKYWLANNKHDYFRIRDSLGLNERKMKLVK